MTKKPPPLHLQRGAMFCDHGIVKVDLFPRGDLSGQSIVRDRFWWVFSGDVE